MDQQVSPAVVIIVLILIVAILVGLYFLVVERAPQSSEEPGMDMGPVDDEGVAPDPDVDEPGDAEAEGTVGADQAQEDTNAEQTGGDSDTGDAIEGEAGDTAGE